MNIPTDIIAFAERWQRKTDHYKDDKLTDIFDHFFSVFVLYNFLYNQIASIQDCKKKRDKEKATKVVRKYLGSNSIYEDESIRESANQIQDLVSSRMFYIRDTYWDSEKITKLNSTDAISWSKGLLELIYAIRCNTSHGSKQYYSDVIEERRDAFWADFANLARKQSTENKSCTSSS